LRNAINSARVQVDGEKTELAGPDLRNVFQNMRHYLYRRPDHPGQLAHHWRTTMETKKVLMVSFRDAFELGRHTINSLNCLDEMKGVVQDEGYIGAEGRAKDDRVVAAALAHIAWKQWVQPRMRSAGLTHAVALKQKEAGRPSQIHKMAIDYLRASKILMPGENIGDKGS
jgi:hypothetical protein